EGLTPQEEYAYQYYIDGELYIADPYTEKVLDPMHDRWISPETYPNLKPYPAGKATGIVGILQTAQVPYTWSGKPYTPPDRNNLNIYELLVRDWVATRRYSTIIDSLSYLKRLGINTIQLLPVNEFEGNESWGYNPSFYFAPDKYYGPKNELKRFIDSCHANGIAVLADIVLNHAFGQSPMVQMYRNATLNRPAANSPWFNEVSPNPTWYWGNDFNHQSIHTQEFVDKVNHHWLTEYRFDGIRFDFTKGFTNTSGDGWARDQQRIDILKRMTDAIREYKPETYVIFEHLTDNSEERELADYGIMLWGNINYDARRAVRGVSSNWSSASYRQRGWSQPGLIAYMESHDEERLMFDAKTQGASRDGYNVRDEATALRRAGLAATVFFAIPGPKMLWQFGELGYDYSINACPDGTISSNDRCRTSNKAIRWDYFQDPSRRNLYNHYATILQLRQKYDVFSTTDFSTSLSGVVKSVTLRSSDMNVVVVGNFALTAQTPTLTFPTAGTWYEYFSQDTVTFDAAQQTLSLRVGEYRIYSDRKIEHLDVSRDIVTSVPALHTSAHTPQLHLYPNPVQDKLNVQIDELQLSGNLQLVIYNMSGQEVLRRRVDGTTSTIATDSLSSGSYVLSVQDERGKQLGAKAFVK
ncbi:MAG: alpha-amylase family glycosyl hydrolase, partial [Kiritimatiellaeota bacterium]|nr:alpha-amylase family glycosyl hydrolase [Kiritimatiellota bacterium]